MKILRYFKIGIPVLLAIVVILFLHKNLPRTAVVQITGTDVKRLDLSATKPKKGESGAKSEAVRQTSDVRFINALSKNGKTMVFRNEDTGWGWPPYFKFDSADLTAKAQAIALAQEEVWVQIRYYGWRIRIFSMFPNAVSLTVVDRNHSQLPVFNIFFILLVIILGLLIRKKAKKIFKRGRGDKKPPATPGT